MPRAALLVLVLLAPAALAQPAPAPDTVAFPDVARPVEVAVGDGRLSAYFAHADGSPWLPGETGERGVLKLLAYGNPNASLVYTVRIANWSLGMHPARTELDVLVAPPDLARAEGIPFTVDVPPVGGTPLDLRVGLEVEVRPVNATGDTEDATVELATVVAPPPAPPLRWDVVAGSLGMVGAVVATLVALLRRFG